MLSKNRLDGCVIGLSGRPMMMRRLRKKEQIYSSFSAAALDPAFLLLKLSVYRFCSMSTALLLLKDTFFVAEIKSCAARPLVA
jgi:hypothetical protein